MKKGDYFSFTEDDYSDQEVISTHRALKDFTVAETLERFEKERQKPHKTQRRYQYVKFLETEGFCEKLVDGLPNIHLGSYGKFTPLEYGKDWIPVV